MNSTSLAPDDPAAASSTTSALHPRRRARVESSSSPTRPSSSSSAPAAKRTRLVTDLITPTTAAMSAKMQGKLPDVIDLTATSPDGSSEVSCVAAKHTKGRRVQSTPQLRPSGTKRFVIKNLKVVDGARHDAAAHYKRVWKELEAALEALFAGRPPRQPWEMLVRGVEDLCRNEQAEQLHGMLRDRCEAYLNGEVLSCVKEDITGTDNVTVLRVVLDQWRIWSEKLTLIRRTFSYLNQSYLLNIPSLQQINDMGITLFRRALFKDVAGPAPGVQALVGLCELIDFDRQGDERFDSVLLKESITMLHILNVYAKHFEQRFLEASHQLLEEFGEEKSETMTLRDYIGACKRLLREEEYRCQKYNFDSTTKRLLMADARKILIERYSAKLVHGGSVATLLAEHDVESMKALYNLLGLSDLRTSLKAPWEDYIVTTGSEIVSDAIRSDEMAVRLLGLRRWLDVMVRDAFGGDSDFTKTLRDAFGHFMNDKRASSQRDTGTSKVGEMIAKYIDMLLRGGLKTLPASLLCDSNDEEGLARAGDEDAELDRQLDNGLELFRHLDGKDVFEAFYKKDLARRLLMGRSASQDAERNMINKLKSECGHIFVHNIEQMFKDQELAKDEMAAYKQWLEGSGQGKKARLDLHVSVLSAAAWPTYPDVRVFLPKEVGDEITRFDNYYKNQHTGRQLTWKHNLAHCAIKAKFDRGAKELLVSAFQAAVLMLFNDVEDQGAEGVLSYEQISQATGLQGGELERTLQSLACGRARVLTKYPKGRDVAVTDTFTVNRAFRDDKYRVKINQIQLRETPAEAADTHRRVAADRQFETQAAIVRIMKSRKTMAHVQLVAEVINQTKSRGAVDAGEIKKNIEKLMEKEYLERDGPSYKYLA